MERMSEAPNTNVTFHLQAEPSRAMMARSSGFLSRLVTKFVSWLYYTEDRRRRRTRVEKTEKEARRQSRQTRLN